MLDALDDWLGGTPPPAGLGSETVEEEEQSGVPEPAGDAVGSDEPARPGEAVRPSEAVPPGEAGLADLRRGYGHGVLDDSTADPDPIMQFRWWLHDALAGPVVEPNAMVVATADSDGMPSARTVLLKGLDERGFVFYTNYRSDKGADLEVNPRAALVFPWHAMERQVRVAGPVSRVSTEESDAYFDSRPWESRLGAVASPQSEVVADRASLDAAYDAVADQWRDKPDVPRPEHWGGYRVAPQVVEFWQGRTGRLHDRLRYRRTDDGWVLERLAP